jgi:hypothetical protein
MMKLLKILLLIAVVAIFAVFVVRFALAYVQDLAHHT